MHLILTSSAFAKALIQYASTPPKVTAYSPSFNANSISGAPPPAISALCFTKHRMTHRASCSDLSASSKTNLLLPRTRTVTVFP